MGLDHHASHLEELRSNILAGIPRSLIGTSDNKHYKITDPDLSEAKEFLETQACDAAWKHSLAKFIVLKETLQSGAPNGSCGAIPSSVSRLLEIPDLLQEMLVADGPTGGNWPRAMEIYEEIQRESDAVSDTEDHPVLHRLAIAISLVHATPVAQTNPLANAGDEDCDNPEDVVDPVRRYLNYEISYLEGELYPFFPTLTTWELRFVVDGDESDEVAAWGRSALRNYYPDHVLSDNPSWFCASIVQTDAPYGSSRVKDDDPKLHKYQNILRNGGICGRRAFFGRFVLRAFGVPTTARPSKGHAALCHWTGPGVDSDWAVNLGAGWGKGWTWTRYSKDLDFLATTRARRRNPARFSSVALARCLGDLFGEPKVYGIYDPKEKGCKEGVPLDLGDRSVIGLWYRLSLALQESILAAPPSPALLPNSGPDETLIDTARKKPSHIGSCSYGTDEKGRATICLPAASFADPRGTKDVSTMKGFFRSKCNTQIHLPPFQPQGTTILRGGSWKEEPTGLCQSGARLLSGGKGKYEDWGLRMALSCDEDNPEPTRTVALTREVTMEFVYIPPGSFVMGGKKTSDSRFRCVEVPHHPVAITKGFYMGKFPVTQAQYEAVRGTNRSKSTRHPSCPVDNVGVEDALAFCLDASAKSGSDIRLPTEAEWEYAARGSTSGDSAGQSWFFGSDASAMDDYAWYKANSGGKSHPVGQKKPNPFGLYDVYGNVWERVSDTYKKEYYAELAGQGVAEDPAGPSQGNKSRFRYDMRNVPEEGSYALTARACTVTVNQTLKVSPNDNGEEFKVELPYTLGEWKDSPPVVLPLKQGHNTLSVWRDAPPQYGVSLREFRLTKVD